MSQSEERDRQLRAALRAVARADERLESSAPVEARLLQEVRSIAWARRRRMYLSVVPIAAALILVVGLTLWRGGSRPDTDSSVSPVGAPAVQTATAFLPLLYSNVPTNSTHTVVLDVPQSALSSFGLVPVDSVRNASAKVRAEVLVGEDGLARAVRFVRPGAGQEQRP